MGALQFGRVPMPARSERVSFCVPAAHLVRDTLLSSVRSAPASPCLGLVKRGLLVKRDTGRHFFFFFWFGQVMCFFWSHSLWPQLSAALAGRLWIQAGVSDPLNREHGKLGSSYQNRSWDADFPSDPLQSAGMEPGPLSLSNIPFPQYCFEESLP